MYSVLYQTFYPYNKFDDVNDIRHLSTWMLSKNVLSLLNECIAKPVTPAPAPSVQSPPSHIPPSEPAKKRVIIPDKVDTLFWCIYMYHYGEEKYLAIGNKYGNAEISEKQKIMEFLKSNKNALKNVNRKITLGAAQEIMSDLMTNTKTSLQTVAALSVFYKKNILLLNKNNKTCIEYLFDKDQSPNSDLEPTNMKWLVIEYMENKKYGFFAEETTDISNYINTYIRIETYDKPLKGISTYKMGELVSIASNISELAKETKLSKPELYGKIWHSCLWV